MKRLICLALSLAITGTACGAAMTKSNKSTRKPVKSAAPLRAEVVGNEVTLLNDRKPRRIERTDATYVAPHFAKLVLGDGDSLTVRSEDGVDTWTYTKDTVPKRPEGFWSIAIDRRPNETKAVAIIELKNESLTATYEIDRVAVGLPPNDVVSRNLPPSGFLEICGTDDSKEAACYAGEAFHNKSKAVARLLINGQNACTGWLVGSQGHMITNHHCISTAADAANVQVEMMAEGTACPQNCNSWFACKGKRVAMSVQFIRAGESNDYALVKVSPSIAATYGFFKLRQSGPVKNEQIYIPQHPRGSGKRIALKSSDPKDASGPTAGFAHINTTLALACSGFGLPEVGYNADTDPGSSGSPVVAMKDQSVVALHHCGGCPNHAIPITRVISEIKNDLPADAFAP